MFRKLLLILSLTCSLTVDAQQNYTEFYRPQFHLSPGWGWMGDPNGMIYFGGKFHLLWWGHALSDDLVHWVEYNNFAMNGGPSGFGYWSGSVVADIHNTAGFNTAEDTALVAVYTMHYDGTAYEKVGISSSLNHIGFQYYPENPVIDINQRDFRDPQVFWHQPTNRWIMVIAKAADHAVEIWASSDLKAWEKLSSFSEKGDKDQLWEVPDLFQLPLNDDPSNKKWIMTCGMGPNKVQYWVGDFDGTSFHLDTTDNLFTGKNIPGEVFADFEEHTYGNWTVTGTAFGSAPCSGTLPAQQEVNGYIGRGFINSYVDGDPSTGKMTSPEFTIQKNFINYLIGGGNVHGIQISLWVDGTEVLTGKSLQSQEMLRWDGWDVSSWKGKTAHIEILDNATGGWGHILIDQIVFSDELYDTHFENANWVDWGKDFYAARSYRNYDNPEADSTMWIAWMGNWAYANNIPTTPWKGHESIPRVIKLVQNDNGYQLRQYPIGNLSSLRTEPYSMNETAISGTQQLSGFKPEWNVYEMNLSFKIDNRNQKFGISLAEDSQGKKLAIGYDAHTSKIYIDRRNAGLVSFSQSFPVTMYAPTPFPADSIMDLHIYLDQSSVEVFANQNQTTLSALVFTKPPATGISLFSDNGEATLLKLEAWNLNSIWGVTPDQLPNDIKETPAGKSHGSRLFPNPLKKGEALSVMPAEDIMIREGIIEITDLCGRTVRTEALNNTRLSGIRVEGLSALGGGSYIFRLKSQPVSLVEKFVIL